MWFYQVLPPLAIKKNNVSEVQLAFANSIAYIVITMIFSVARASLTYDNDVIATTLHISNDFATDVFSTFDSKIIKLTCFPGVVFGRQVLLLSRYLRSGTDQQLSFSYCRIKVKLFKT